MGSDPLPFLGSMWKMKVDYTIKSSNVNQTIECGRKLTHYLKPGDCIFLYGDMGAGKTIFVKGIAQGLNISETVTSPSFTIINEYNGTLPFCHIDLYRVSPADVFFLGLEEYLWGKGIAAVEWADRLKETDHARIWSVFIEHKSKGKRIITIQCPERSRKKMRIKK